LLPILCGQLRGGCLQFLQATHIRRVPSERTSVNDLNGYGSPWSPWYLAECCPYH